MRFTARLTLHFVFASLFALLSAGQTNSSIDQHSQDNPPAPSQPAPQRSGDQEKKAENVGKTPAVTPGTSDKAATTSQGTSKDRLFYTLPNFLTLENGGKVPPLTAKEKFAVVARGTFDPVEFPWWGILSAIGQAQNSEPAYGQGWAAYGKRYGTQAADSTIENFFTGAVFPSILHQDPRFFQSSTGSFGRRAWYSVTRIVVTRSDSGHPQFNASEIFGSALGAAVSTYSYHPRSTFVSTAANPHMFISSQRTLANTANVWATQVGLDTITIVVKEFWPDIHRKLSHHPKREKPNS